MSMVPAMAPDVSSAQFQLLLQLLTKFLRRGLQQVLLLGELHGTNMRGKQDISGIELTQKDLSHVVRTVYSHRNA